MIIVITGTPGTGKTTASRILGKKINADVLHLNEFVEQKKSFLGFDEKQGWVDLRKLKKCLKKEFAKHKELIVESHILCEISLKPDAVFILRCKPKELEKRLKKRKYSKEKVEENLLAEMLDYCTQKTEANYKHQPLVEIETADKKPKETAEIIRKIFFKRIVYNKKIKYKKELIKFLKLKKLKK